MRLAYKKITKYKYKLSKDFTIATDVIGHVVDHEFYSLSIRGKLTISKGYLWDGVSGPTWDSENTMVGGCIHDALYQMIRMELIPLEMKQVADTLFRATLLKSGMWRIRAWYYYIAVHLFGRFSCRPGDIKVPKEKEIIYY